MNCSPSSVSTRCAASPASRLSSANRGLASMFPWPMTSWTMSGSGVYSGSDGGGTDRVGGVAHVLRGVEDALGKRAIELAQRDETRRRVVLEAGQRLQARGDLVELRDAVLGQPERGLGLEEVAAGVLRVLGAQLAAHGAPDLVLHVGVGDLRDRLAGRPER